MDFFFVRRGGVAWCCLCIDGGQVTAWTHEKTGFVNIVSSL